MVDLLLGDVIGLSFVVCNFIFIINFLVAVLCFSCLSLRSVSSSWSFSSYVLVFLLFVLPPQQRVGGGGGVY